MATFVVLAKWTDKTYAGMKDAAAVAEEIKKFVAEKGAKIIAWYVLMGQYDEMCILEAPNAETVAKIIVPLNAKFGGRTETLQAFSEAEAMELFASMK
ncbi:MAG: GYD domain-containing protein [Syntrophobacterales bacterium]|jgi:uncharacterized protein with GYD domain